METTPVTEKRKLRPRKPPVATADPDLDSDEEIRGRRKSRKTTSRSVKKGKKPEKAEQESVHTDGDDVAAQGDDLGSKSSKGGKGKAGSTQRKLKVTKVPKAKGESVANGGKKKKKARSVVKGDIGTVKEEEEDELRDEQEEELRDEEEKAKEPTKRVTKKKTSQASDAALEAELIGDPFDDVVARKRWPHRYQRKGPESNFLSHVRSETPEDLRARRHYSFAKVDGVMFELYDDAYVKAENDKPDYICRIVEIFEGVDCKAYFTAQWFFRAEDTVLKEHGKTLDERRLFLSEDKNDNPLDCLGAKLEIVRVEPNIDLVAKSKAIPKSSFYYDMSYSVAYSTFENLSTAIDVLKELSTSVVSSESANKEKNRT